MEWIFVGLLAVVCIILFIVLIVASSRHKRELLKKENEYYQSLAKLRDERQQSPEEEKLRAEKIKAFENRILELDTVINEKKALIEKLNDEILGLTMDINELNEEVVKWTIVYKTMNDKVVEASDEKDKIIEEGKRLNEAFEAKKTALDGKILELRSLENEIEDLKELKRLAILNQDKTEEGLWDFSINDKENQLILILERIKTDYPDLKLDISSIEWKRIWLPKIQDLCNEQGLNRKGIYRLILKSNEDICYVGQAVNIKDRWYQHIKKMIGVDIKGGEKLYNYRPEDFYWTVVEFDCKDLNEREHYWIDYFGCKEKGLNKKA